MLKPESTLAEGNSADRACLVRDEFTIVAEPEPERNLAAKVRLVPSPAPMADVPEFRARVLVAVIRIGDINPLQRK